MQKITVDETKVDRYHRNDLPLSNGKVMAFRGVRGTKGVEQTLILGHPRGPEGAMEIDKAKTIGKVVRITGSAWFWATSFTARGSSGTCRTRKAAGLALVNYWESCQPC